MSACPCSECERNRLLEALERDELEAAWRATLEAARA